MAIIRTRVSVLPRDKIESAMEIAPPYYNTTESMAQHESDPIETYQLD
jgi:hypothetical protein